MFRHFPHIFVTYFYRGECTGFFIATKSKPVDIGLQPFTKGDKRQRKMRRLPQIFTRFTTDDNG
ncbi:hypothetical protein M114_1799 [Bacteroides fragilis str. 3986 N(B)22]|nr:hypothetical protein M111_4504 [Bacteroides fragilis str. 3986T(B)10]EYA52755.1 hypothetical protein M114_1799 [Bacteroides fragilis str. 3986 N(B)22]